MKIAEKYFSKHVVYNAMVHFLIGMGFGMLIVHPVMGGHTVRWGLFLIMAGFLGHLYPLTLNKGR